MGDNSKVPRFLLLSDLEQEIHKLFKDSDSKDVQELYERAKNARREIYQTFVEYESWLDGGC